MCGIAGMAGFCDEGLLRLMVESLRHRGPDDEGFFMRSPNVGLGMRRLAIIDLAGGKQPMFNEDGRIALVFNGEIYNFKELRAELEAKGHKFKTNSDTETIVHLYEEEGVDCPKRLRGMFAFAIWDENKQLLFLARDHLGVKPLYYASLGDKLVFASELKGLLAYGELPRQINFKAIDLFLTYLYIPSPLTIFENVFKLEPGCSLMWKNGVVNKRRYWSEKNRDSPHFCKKMGTVPIFLGGDKGEGRLDENEICARIENLISEAVKEQLVSDVPLGLFLSGGLDSSTITALAKQFVSQPLKVFTVAYSPPDTDYNEISKAERIAVRFGCEHRICVLKPDVEQLTEQIVRAFDEPFADSSAVPTFLISREARKDVTVALTGIGGDEVFAGYPRYIGARLSRYLDVLPVPVRRALAKISAVLPEHGGSIDWPGRIKRFLRECEFPLNKRYQAWVSAFSDSMKKELYSEDFKVINRDSPHFSWKNGDCPYDINAVTSVDLAGYLPEDLLTMADRMSMANSLELRVPMCDVRLVEFMSGLPLSLKTRNFRMKYLLKKAMCGALPETIISQKKMGFMMPLTRWTRDELNNLIDDCLSEESIRKRGYFNSKFVREMISLHRAGKKNFADHIWALLMLELWHREYVGGKDSATVLQCYSATVNKESEAGSRRLQPASVKERRINPATTSFDPSNPQSAIRDSQSISLPVRSRILLLNIAGIGDFVETVPAMEAIRQHYPEAHITMLVSAKAMGFAEDCPYADTVISVPTKFESVWGNKSFNNLIRLLSLSFKLRRTRFDVAMNFHELGTKSGARRLSWFLKIIKAKCVIGRDTDGLGLMYTHAIIDSRNDGKSVYDYVKELAHLAGCSKVPGTVKLWIRNSDRQKRDTLFSAHGLTGSAMLIGIQSGSERSTRRYFPEKYAEIADSLIDLYKAQIIIFGNTSDIDSSEKIVRSMRHNAVNLTGMTDLKVMAAAFERLSLLVCSDSSAMHIGRAVGVPVAAIIGSGNPVRDRTAGDQSQIRLLHEYSECSPCYHLQCPEYDYMKCMKKIRPEDVLAAAQELLKPKNTHLGSV